MTAEELLGILIAVPLALAALVGVYVIYLAITDDDSDDGYHQGD